MKSLLTCVTVFALLSIPDALALADHPKPSVYPKSWQIDIAHGKPARTVVSVPGQAVPQAYWYMTYTVTNNSGEERTFLPVFELLTEDGKILRSDRNVPLRVFETIKKQTGMKFLEQSTQIAGPIRLGEDQARDGVAIWSEPNLEMGSFSIFVTGLSGEFATVHSADDKETILRKTLQLNYLIRGDEVYPGEDEVNDNPEQWIMR
jgi:hypothetical protein